jgi:hypothetical protein
MRRRLTAGALTVLLAAGPSLAVPALAGAASGAKAHAAAKQKGGGGAGGGAGANGGQSTLPTPQTNPLSGLPTPGGTPTSTTAAPPPAVVNTTAGAGGGGGISSGSAIGIAVAAFVIIAGIAIAIMRDARRRVKHDKPQTPPEERVPGSKRPPKARKLSSAERRRRKRGRAPRR